MTASANALRLQVILGAVDNLTKPLRHMLGGTSGLSKALKETRDRLKDLEDKAGRLDKFERTVQSARDASAAFRDARAKLADLNAKVDAARTKQAELVGPVQRLRAEYKALVAEYGRGGDKVEGFGFKLHKTREELEKAEDRYRRAQNASRALKAEITDATKAVAAAQERKRNYSEALRRVTERLKEAGLGTRNLGQQQGHLKEQTDAANKAIEAQGKRLQQVHAARARYEKDIEKRNNLAGAGAAGVAIGAASAAPILATARAFADAEDAATGLKVAMMGPGGKLSEEYLKIKELAERLGDRLPGTTADFLEMMTMLRRQGLSAQNILGGTGEAAAYLGVQLKMAPSAAAEFAAKMQDATRTTETDMLGLMDVIQRTFYLGVDPTNMLAGFSKLSPALTILRQQGLEAAKSLAPLLAMADQSGMAGEAAGNAYRKIFQQAVLRSHSKDGQGEFGLDFTNGKGEFGGLDKLFSELAKLKSKTTEERGNIIKTIFGDDAEVMQAVALMIDKGKAGYDETLAKMEAQADLQRRVNEQLGTLKNLWEAASGTFTNALAAFGEAISPELKELTQWIGDMSASVRQFATEHPQFTGALMKILAVVALLATGFGALVLAVSAVLGPMAFLKVAMSVLGINFGLSIGAMAARFSGFMQLVWTAVKANPWALAIAGLASVFVYLWERWDQLKAMFRAGDWAGIFSTVMRAIENAVDTLTLGLYSKIKAVFLAIFEKPLEYIWEKLKNSAHLFGFGSGQTAPAPTAAPLRAGGATGTWNTTHNVTVNAAPGQNPQDVGKEVTRQLDERERRKAAARRSIFADHD